MVYSMEVVHYFLFKKNKYQRNYLNIFILPSLANPKSVSLSTALSAILVKSKFSGLRSPVEIFFLVSFSFLFIETKDTYDEPKIK